MCRSCARSDASNRSSCALRFATTAAETPGFAAACPRWTVLVSANVPTTAANASERATMNACVRGTLLLLREKADFPKVGRARLSAHQARVQVRAGRSAETKGRVEAAARRL